MRNIDLAQFGLECELYNVSLAHNTQTKLPTGPLASASARKVYQVLVLDVEGNGSAAVYPIATSFDIDSDNAPRITVTYNSSVTRNCTVAVIFQR